MNTRNKTKEDRDILLIGFLFRHKGRKNAVSSKSICDFLKENGHHMKPTSLFPNIHRIMYEHNLPICYIPMNGYYIAENKEDIAPVVKDLKQRMGGFQRHIDFLEAQANVFKRRNR